MILLKSDKDSLRRVLREAVKIKDVKENDRETATFTVEDIEKEITFRLKLLNSKKNEYYLPTFVATGVTGVSESFDL